VYSFFTIRKGLKLAGVVSPWGAGICFRKDENRDRGEGWTIKRRAHSNVFRCEPKTGSSGRGKEQC